MAMVVQGSFVGVVVDSGLHLGRPRLLAVPMAMGVRLPAGVSLVAVPMGLVGLPAGAQLGAGAMAVAAGAGGMGVAGECPSRGRRSVRATAAANGVSSALLPYYASSGAGLFFGSAASSDAGFVFGSAASSVALAAGSRAPAGRASVVVAATGGSPADGGEVDDDDDSTPAEIDDEEKRIQEEKEKFMSYGEKYILGWGPEKALSPPRGVQYQEWLLLPREDEDGAPAEKDAVTPAITTMFTKECVLQLIRDFNPKDAPTETFLICKEKNLIDFFGGELVYGASLLEQSMIARPPSVDNYEALATIGKELKLAAAECQRGYLQSASLDRSLVAMKRLRATSAGLPEDCLGRLDIKASLPQRPRREFGIDETLQKMTYFILMAAYAYHVMVALEIDMYRWPPTGYF